MIIIIIYIVQGEPAARRSAWSPPSLEPSPRPACWGSAAPSRCAARPTPPTGGSGRSTRGGASLYNQGFPYHILIMLYYGMLYYDILESISYLFMYNYVV